MKTTLNKLKTKNELVCDYTQKIKYLPSYPGMIVKNTLKTPDELEKVYGEDKKHAWKLIADNDYYNTWYKTKNESRLLSLFLKGIYLEGFEDVTSIDLEIGTKYIFKLKSKDETKYRLPEKAELWTGTTIDIIPIINSEIEIEINEDSKLVINGLGIIYPYVSLDDIYSNTITYHNGAKLGLNINNIKASYNSGAWETIANVGKGHVKGEYVSTSSGGYWKVVDWWFTNQSSYPKSESPGWWEDIVGPSFIKTGVKFQEIVNVWDSKEEYKKPYSYCYFGTYEPPEQHKTTGWAESTNDYFYKKQLIWYNLVKTKDSIWEKTFIDPVTNIKYKLNEQGIKEETNKFSAEYWEVG